MSDGIIPRIGWDPGLNEKDAGGGALTFISAFSLRPNVASCAPAAIVSMPHALNSSILNLLVRHFVIEKHCSQNHAQVTQPKPKSYEKPHYRAGAQGQSICQPWARAGVSPSGPQTQRLMSTI